MQPTSERTGARFRPRFPRLKIRQRRQATLDELTTKHRGAGRDWFAVADSEGLVSIRPTRNSLK